METCVVFELVRLGDGRLAVVARHVGDDGIRDEIVGYVTPRRRRHGHGYRSVAVAPCQLRSGARHRHPSVSA